MIFNFGNKDTERVWKGEWVSSWPSEILVISRRKLRMLHASTTLQDLLVPPSNRLEKLSGNLKQYYSIRINKKWRIIFKWNEGFAEDVKIIDYH